MTVKLTTKMELIRDRRNAEEERIHAIKESKLVKRADAKPAKRNLSYSEQVAFAQGKLATREITEAAQKETGNLRATQWTSDRSDRSMPCYGGKNKSGGDRSVQNLGLRHRLHVNNLKSVITDLPKTSNIATMTAQELDAMPVTRQSKSIVDHMGKRKTAPSRKVRDPATFEVTKRNGSKDFAYKQHKQIQAFRRGDVTKL